MSHSTPCCLITYLMVGPMKCWSVLLLPLCAVLATEIAVDLSQGQPSISLGHAPSSRKLCTQKSKVWGPGLDPTFHLPVRYFYIQAVDSEGHNFTVSLGNIFRVSVTKDGNKVRASTDVIDRQDGVYLARMRLSEEVDELTVEVRVKDGGHISGSPYKLRGPLYHEACSCSEPDGKKWGERMQCKENYTQVSCCTDIFLFIYHSVSSS